MFNCRDFEKCLNCDNNYNVIKTNLIETIVMIPFVMLQVKCLWLYVYNVNNSQVKIFVMTSLLFYDEWFILNFLQLSRLQ